MAERKQVSEQDCLFCKLVRKEIPSWVFYENDKFVAFLTPFPSTLGQVVTAPKEHLTDYYAEMSDEDISDFMKFNKQIAKRMDNVFGVAKTALVFEGAGVAHVHAKLFPLHGKMGAETNISFEDKHFWEEYPGFIDTRGGPKMDDKKLGELRDKLKF